MRCRWERRALALAAGVLACGGGGPFTPDLGDPRTGETAVFVLRTVAGEPLPAAWIANEDVTITVRADTIRLRSDGTGTRVVVEHVAEQNQPVAPERSVQASLEYRMSGERIEIDLTCDDVILQLCVAPPHLLGVRTRDALELDHALNYRVPLRYERVGR
ncbi:MAG TPA: hypothetical protein VFU46_02160 [Gemmatimonadales bacterium]|nr:hypothetical protein [Gemmatimonadales bacterium]